MSGPCLKRRQAKLLLLSAILSTVALAQSGLASPSLSAPPGGTILLAQSGPGNQRDQIEDAPRARRKAEPTAQLQMQWQQAPGQQTGPLSARRVHGVRATPAAKLPTAVRQGQQASEAAFTTAGVAPRQESAEPFKLANSQLEPVKWAELEGWAAEDHVAALDAFQMSCQPLRRIKRPSDDRPIFLGLWEICRRAPGVRPRAPRLHAASSRKISGPCVSRAWAKRRAS